MPVYDQSAGRAYVWVITSFLCFSLVAGGICLLIYLFYPPSETTHWLPILGVILVGLPWFFWFLTCMYRICSRVCGISIGIGGPGGCGGSGGNYSNAGGSVAASNISHGDQTRSKSTRSDDSEAPLSKSMSS